MLKHTLTGTGKEGVRRAMEGENDREREGASGEGRSESRLGQVRDRFQHAGFDRTAPPGAENTKPCDYPKHTETRALGQR